MAFLSFFACVYDFSLLTALLSHASAFFVSALRITTSGSAAFTGKEHAIMSRRKKKKKKKKSTVQCVAAHLDHSSSALSLFFLVQLTVIAYVFRWKLNIRIGSSRSQQAAKTIHLKRRGDWSIRWSPLFNESLDRGKAVLVHGGGRKEREEGLTNQIGGYWRRFCISSVLSVRKEARKDQPHPPT